jgi:predicted secreted protein
MLEALSFAHRRNPRAVIACVATAVALTMASAALPAAEGEPQKVHVNEAIAIELDGNSTTGYRWQLDDGASEDGDLVKVEDLGYVKRVLKPGERPLLGAPSKYQFRVTGLEAGTVKLVFQYVKGNDTPPGKTQEVPIEVVGD